MINALKKIIQFLNSTDIIESSSLQVDAEQGEVWFDFSDSEFMAEYRVVNTVSEFTFFVSLSKGVKAHVAYSYNKNELKIITYSDYGTKSKAIYFKNFSNSTEEDLFQRSIVEDIYDMDMNDVTKLLEVSGTIKFFCDGLLNANKK